MCVFFDKKSSQGVVAFHSFQTLFCLWMVPFIPKSNYEVLMHYRIIIQILNSIKEEFHNFSHAMKYGPKNFDYVCASAALWHQNIVVLLSILLQWLHAFLHFPGRRAQSSWSKMFFFSYCHWTSQRNFGVVVDWSSVALKFKIGEFKESQTHWPS